MTSIKNSDRVDPNSVKVGKAAFEFLQISQKIGLAAAAAGAIKEHEQTNTSRKVMLAAAIMAASLDDLSPNNAIQIKKTTGEITDGSDASS